LKALLSSQPQSFVVGFKSPGEPLGGSVSVVFRSCRSIQSNDLIGEKSRLGFGSTEADVYLGVGCLLNQPEGAVSFGAKGTSQWVEWETELAGRRN
jgi:hypothetical protein